MADEVAETQVEENAEVQEDRRTMTYMMAHPEEAPQFAAVQPDDPEEEVVEPESGLESQPETPEVAVVSETPVEAAIEEPPKFAPKHKSWEETEKARVEAEKLITAKAEEAKAEREAREALEAKIAEQERLAAEAAKPKPLTEDERDEIYAKAAADLADLDQGDPDYLKNYGRILRKANDAANPHAQFDPSLTPAEIANKAWEEIKAKQAEESAKTAEQRKTEEDARTEASARELGIKAGLNLNDPESADSIIWDRLKQKIPQEVFDKGTLEAQVEWVAQGVRQKTGQVVEQTDVEREQARMAQKNNAVLGKGVAYTPPQEPPKSRTMSEMIAERASRGPF